MVRDIVKTKIAELIDHKHGLRIAEMEEEAIK
jgi:hypothetical protein